MDYQTIQYHINERILTITLNRPEQMNAFTVEMANELESAFYRASEDDEVGAIVVTGAGKAFCAGMDLSKEGNVFGLNEIYNPP
jgi:enoyl-CoA hydratase/carnithine racemase